MAPRTKTPRDHETPPPHMLDNSFDDLQGESHEDIDSTQHFYRGASRAQISGTISINFLVDNNLVPLKIQQIASIYEYLD